MKKGKKTLLPKTMAAVLSMALVVGALWNAAPVNVLAAELAAPVDNMIGEPETDEESAPGENLPEETTPEEAPQGGTFNAARSMAEGDTYNCIMHLYIYGEKAEFPYQDRVEITMVSSDDGSEVKGKQVEGGEGHEYIFELERGKAYAIKINDWVGPSSADNYPRVDVNLCAANFYDGDVLQDVQYIAAGRTASEPEPLKKNGYTFTGWVTENGGSQKFNFSDSINGETNIYASWTKDSSGDENKDWTLGEDGTLTILSQAGMDDWKAHDAGKESQVVKVIVQGTVTELKESQFNSYKNLKEIDMTGSQITKIGGSAFQDCVALQSVVLPGGIETIENWAFLRCESLKEISIPGSVKELKGETFSGCTGLEKVVMQGNVPPELVSENSMYNIFEDCGFVTGNTKGILVPEGAKAAYDEKWSDWKDYITDGTVEDTRSKITAVQAQLLDFTVPALGAEVQTPTLVSDKEQLYTSISWQKKNEEGNWTEVTDSHYTEGVYCLRASFTRQPQFAGDWVITPDCSVTVDGQVWTVVPDSYFNGAEANYIDMYSPEYVVSDTKAGEINKEVVKEENAPDMMFAETPEELAELLLTEEEKQQAAAGKDIRIVLSVRDADAIVSSEHKAAVEAALHDFTLGQYLDIRLIKFIEDIRREISETKGKLTITIAVPDRLKNTGSQSARTFGVIRVHDGQAEFLEDLDQSEDTITIETDRFSTYAIVYQDDAKDSGNENGGGGSTGGGDENGGGGSTGGGDENGGGGSTGGGDENGGGGSVDSGNANGGSGSSAGGENGSEGSADSVQGAKDVQNPESKGSGGNAAGVQEKSPVQGKDQEPKTGDTTPLELYATLAMIAGLAYLLIYFTDAERGMSEEKKKELIGTLVRWARQGGRLRRLAAFAAVFVLLVYYHGTKNLHRSVERKTVVE